MKLQPPADFAGGQQLWLDVGQNGDTPVKQIYLRLLQRNQPPDADVGGIGTYAVPPQHVVRVPLSKDFHGIIQVSIHGGANPFGNHVLSPNNGCPTLEGVEVH
jgi:hypothetical protein